MTPQALHRRITAARRARAAVRDPRPASAPAPAPGGSRFQRESRVVHAVAALRDARRRTDV